MQAGTLYGIAGAMNAIVSKYTRDLAPAPCRILATGGAWHMTAGLVDFAYEPVPDLTLIGTAFYR
jgi:pantothenate kinase type III